MFIWDIRHATMNDFAVTCLKRKGIEKKKSEMKDNAGWAFCDYNVTYDSKNGTI